MDPLVRGTQTLMLDSQIRDWVVLPLLVIMITAGLLRAQVGRLLRPPQKPVKSVDTRAKSAILRSSRLRGGAGGFLSGTKWEARRQAWSAREGSSSNNNNGWLRHEAARVETDKKLQEAIKAQSGEDENPTSSALMPGMDPSTMMEGMKGNMAAMVQNMVMMQGISHFFRGFVLVRVPFPLTRGFKQMFQRGLFDLTTLDTSYVSSVSWYFLVMFGLRAFFRLAMGDPVQEEMEGVEYLKESGMEHQGPQQVDGTALLTAEADNLELLNMRSRRFKVDDAEKSLLGRRYPKKIRKSLPAVLFGGMSPAGKSKGTRIPRKKGKAA